MASTLSVSTNIDNLIQRTNEVKVCQEHWKVIATDLTRIQHGLNNTHATIDVDRLQEGIAQILKAINEIVTSCSDNEIDLNGMTYKDLESLLLRLHWQLAQHEANMTDDYQMKVQILSNAYQEQQLVQKTSDEILKEKLLTIEQRTKENTTEQLRLLREKHTEKIESYLRSCIELHKNIHITDVSNDTIAKIAHTFYHITSEDQTQLEPNWQVSELPLTRTFAQFKSDKFTPFERNESRQLLVRSEEHSKEETSKSIWQIKSEDKNISEENIIRTKRWIVILGDPGSGKTSFTRWLVHHLAQTFLLNEQQSTDYGPLRIPILIRIGEFAKILNNNPSLTLFDYIGRHKWMGKAIVDKPSITPDDLSCVLQDYIKHGQALIILDGLDEIPVSEQRFKIINIVETFVKTYVQIPIIDSSIFDNSYLNRLFDDPSKTGGNQLIITSRIVGYHTAPVAGQFAHYIIQPMDMNRKKEFIDYWFSHVHQQILDTLSLSLSNQGKNHAEALKNKLEKSENLELFNMASNCSILSFICNLAINQFEGSPLPTKRIYLYEQIINSMLNLWSKRRSITNIPKGIRILSSIAYSICKYSTSNSIDEEEINEICIELTKTSIGKTLLTEEDIQNIESQALEYARIIREDIGILTIRDKSQYSFLYITFQEYFTCLKLIEIDRLKRKKLINHELDQENDIQLISQSLRQHLNDPRFRVPIALAFGKISHSWSQKDFDNLCDNFLQEHDKFESLVPLSAYTLINFSNDFVNYPSNNILFNTLDCLIIAAGQHEWSIICPSLLNQIINTLKNFPNNIISLWINNFLSQSSSHNIQTISTLCYLIEGKPHEFENIKWLNQSSCSILQSLSTLDNENNGFAIDRLLLKVTFSNQQLLSINSTTFKEFLFTQKIQINSIPIILFPLIVTLYGGLKRDGQIIIFDPLHIHRECTVITPFLIRFLSEKDRTKQDQNLKKLKQECIKSFLVRIENQDESSESIDLCIAIMCFYDIEYIQDNLKIIPKSLLRMTMNKLKYISMILRQFYFPNEKDDRFIENEITKFISIIIEKFQYVESARIQFLDLLNSLKNSLARLRSSTKSILLEGISSPHERVTLNLPNTFRKEDKLLQGLLTTDIRLLSDRNSCTLLHHFTKLFWIYENNNEFQSQYRVAVAMDNVPEYLVFRNDEDLLCSLTFLPQHLRNLYLRLLAQKFITINSKDTTDNKKQHLYFSHILTECLMLLSNTSCKKLSILTALITLLPWLRMQKLENLGSSLIWALSIKYIEYFSIFDLQRKREMNNETGQYLDTDENIFGANDLVDEQRRARIERYIEREHERLQTALIEDDEKNMKIYSACISLAYICRWTENERKLSLLEESLQSVMSINNKLIRLDGLCVIAFYSYLDYKQIRMCTNRSLQEEIEYQLNDIYSTLPLLLHATIFIRCLPLLKNQSIIDNCLQNLLKKFVNNDQRDQHAVIEALLPYIQLNSAFSSITKCLSHSFIPDNNRIVHNKSSVLKKYFNINTDDNLSFSLLISNLYLIELTNDFYECINTDTRQYTIDELIITKLCQFENPILTEVQALTITNILSSDSFKQSEDFYVKLSNALHHVNLVEFKASHLVESWLKWKDSNELCSFSYHAALILVNSDIWSMEAATIVCDLLCSKNDRFRQRAEIILRSTSDDDVRTSSKLGIDVLFTLIKKKTYYRQISAAVNLTVNRILGNITLDVQSHLEILLWLERYRIHALVNKEYSFNALRSCTNSYVASFFTTDINLDALSCANLFGLSGDLIIYMCDMIASNFFSFLEIDGDRTSDIVMESHAQFVLSLIMTIHMSFNHNDDTRQLAIEALTNLFEISNNLKIRQAIMFTLGYICNEITYKNLFEKIQMTMNNERRETTNLQSDNILSIMISSYSHCMSVNNIAFDQDDMDLFCSLLKHPSQNVSKAARTGFGRVLKDKLFLFEMLDSDYIQCYNALMDSTAYTFIYNVQIDSANTTAEFIEEHPDLLPIFIAELYNSIRHITNTLILPGDTDYELAYAYPQYVQIASLVAVRMPATFCAYLNNWHDGDNLKRALFYTSKQHNFPQRAACLIILSNFGELTVELCQLFIEALHDDPYIQNTSYKCLTRINSIINEKIVLNLLFAYTKSESMNVRYFAAKMLLHLSRLSSIISSEQVEQTLNDLISDPDSNGDLWLIEEQDTILAQSVYYYAGPLKDVIYSLLVQHITGDKYEIVHRNELNDIDLDFIESKTASRLASCLYEAKVEEKVEIEEQPQPPNPGVDNGENTSLSDISLNEFESDHS